MSPPTAIIVGAFAPEGISLIAKRNRIPSGPWSRTLRPIIRPLQVASRQNFCSRDGRTAIITSLGVAMTARGLEPWVGK